MGMSRSHPKSGKKSARPIERNPKKSSPIGKNKPSDALEAERRAHRQAEAAQQRYRDLIEGLNSTMVWEMGAESFQFTFVSQRAETLLGYPLDRWYTDPSFWRDKLHPEDRERVLDLFKKSLEEGTDQRCDHRMIAADGRTVWFPLKQKTQEAEKASRIKSEFLSIASHEIRTPLNAIVGYAGLLKQGEMGDPEKQKEISERIYQNAKELVDLINRLLDLNKIEAGRMDPHGQANELSLSGMLQQVLRDLRWI
ncbi:MAG: PAS domain-containing hybrid sensor histidine kinase/response regulator [Candidatus Manganitrophaceae bacterium]|nr:MAG: PAS domain-containing hybrid sensor histidine kinase/response regulator [Candidatus Manganitrophaceae bacterium]